MHNPHAMYDEYTTCDEREAERREATERQWREAIDDAEQAADRDSRVQLERGSIRVYHAAQQVHWTWAVCVDSLETADLANALESAAAAIRKANHPQARKG